MMDLATVSDALSGNKSNKMQGLGMMQPIEPINLMNCESKPANWEGALTKIFMGIAFLVVSIVLSFTQKGSQWWFWMLIPAFAMLGSGIAQIIQLRKNERSGFPIDSPVSQNTLKEQANSALPPSQTEYVKPQTSIYDTGELAVPSSVTENTTRHLEVNSEGETMTLPKK
ncbi:MAG: hypothetical protein LC778_05190 [Acidobacteria bacterium]|nr:hypothetical protein [Acidobacteriota bacterium]